MKALILAGGRGKRLGTISQDINKCMVRIFDRPLIEYSLDCAGRLKDISDIVIVVGYRAEDIVNTYGNSYKGKDIKYVVQWEQHGLVDAIYWAGDALDGDDFMLMLGDEFMVNPLHQQMIKKFLKEGLFGICGVIAVDDPELIRKTYSIEQSQEDRISRLIEKPKTPFNNIMGTGNCIFKNKILSYIGKTPINPNRGERELPDLIQCAIDNGNIIKSFRICDRYINVNSQKELKEVNSYFAHL